MLPAYHTLGLFFYRKPGARGAGEGLTHALQILQEAHSIRFRDAFPPQAEPHRTGGGMASDPRQGVSPPSDVPQTGRSGGGSGSPFAKTRQATFEESWAGPRPGSGHGRNRKSHSRRVGFHRTVKVSNSQISFLSTF